ncbi:Panacea domain-containing protein [Alkalibacillus haloalkaliphilus]|uniref:Panacea domain-containing protein n=1 Tax=Alkalibacillus haloalkaliphilus TaxID=94136 RepID=UPI0002E2D312|nr:type II toxin-antitoxin system antitoxin SocA domain-containing protein [Alkalibacillus haloalkaliphilus]
MTYNVRQVSKWFIDFNSGAASETLDGHLKLQKLLYYAQAMKLAVTGEKLFNDRIEAWANGPVVNNMFVEYRHNQFVPRSRAFDTPEFDEETTKILEIVNSIYGSQSSDQLVNLTHSEKPWGELEAEAKNRLNPEIKVEKIREYYEPLADLYEVYKDYDFSVEKIEEINGNVFVYNKHETELSEENYRDLWDFGDKVKNEKYFIYKDENGELVMY